MGRWQDKIVVVAGGSQGLGYHIAIAFQQLGAITVLLARNTTRLGHAVDAVNELCPAGAKRAHGISVDLTDTRAVETAVNEIVDRYGGFDVWVNAAGQSTRADFMETDLDQYRQLMEQNFYTAVNGTLAALPTLQQRKGHLVNIGSLASKTGWPFVSPYVTSKHALSGFAHQLRLEGPRDIHYLYVCPGPIASTSTGDRYQQQTANLPEAARQPGAGAPVKRIAPDQLATQIVSACEKRKLEIVRPLKSRILFSILQLWPTLGDKLIRRFCK